MTKLRRKLPPLGTLVVFDAAFRHRSFTRAAEEVALSQASVSRQIRQLESSLGVQLFERRRHDVIPTAEGNILGDSVRLTLQELASTTERLRFTATGENVFTIFSDFSIASFLITPMLNDLQRQYPNLQLRVLSSYEPIESVTENFDIGFQTGPWTEDRFDVEPIADDAVFPVCSPEFASRLSPNPDALELSKQPLLHLEDVGRDWPDWKRFLGLFRLKQPAPVEGLTFNSYQICLDVAEQGQGIALGWARSVKTKLDEGKLVRIPGMTMPIPESVFVYHPRSSNPHPMTARFVNAVRENVSPVEL